MVPTTKGPVGDHSKTKVAYYYNENYGNFYFGTGHVMKPNRVRMTHHLLIEYGLFKHMNIYKPFLASKKDMDVFHDPQYTLFLQAARPRRADWLRNDMRRFNVGEDCPIFTGLFEYCQISCGASIAAATKLNKKTADIAINWMGGASHAKAHEASGFCYTNDIVLGILELLKYHKRVLYVDIGIFHGDGVEEAFYTTDRVMTVSFHKYEKNFFPGTGDVKSIGHEEGKGYSLNVPLKNGINDQVYEKIFKPIMEKVMERYDPSAIVMQCGADTLAGDKLGSFNLTLKGHGECIRFMRSFKLPMVLLGGGGFKSANTARCWAYDTAIACGRELSNAIPPNCYKEYYHPPVLHINASKRIVNQNNPKYLQQIQREVFQNLNALNFAPSVQMQPIPADSLAHAPSDGELQDMANTDQRLPPQVMDSVVVHDGEFYDFEDGSGALRDEVQYVGTYPYNGPSTSDGIFYG